MKKVCYFFMACILMTACELETSPNGDLDGFWQLTFIDTLSTGGSVDMRKSGVYWAVQMHLLEIQDAETGQGVFFHFQHTGDSLFLYDPYFNTRRPDIIEVKELAVLQPYGINRFEERFAVQALDGSRLQLQSERLRLHFRRY